MIIIQLLYYVKFSNFLNDEQFTQELPQRLSPVCLKRHTKTFQVFYDDNCFNTQFF